MSLNIPPSLFKKDVLYIPLLISQYYEDFLNELGLYEDAKIHEKKVIGGRSDKATLKFFSKRFLNSCARTEYFILNPYQKHSKFAIQVMGTLLYGKVGILDIPCGSGASIMTLINVLYELRKKNISQPLQLILILLVGIFQVKQLNYTVN